MLSGIDGYEALPTRSPPMRPGMVFLLERDDCHMVLVVDTGGRLDVSQERLWKLIFAHVPDMAKIHAGRDDWQGVMVDDHTLVGTYTDLTGGKRTPIKLRLSVFPPLGFAFEALEGPLAGSKFFQYFEAKGRHIETTVVGDFQSAVIPAGELEKVARDFLQVVWDEDLAYLSRMA